MKISFIFTGRLRGESVSVTSRRTFYYNAVMGEVGRQLHALHVRWAMRGFLVLAVCAVLACGEKDEKQPPIVYENNDPNAGGPAAGLDGSACSADSSCDGAVCLTSGTGWQGGYCTTLDCLESGCHGTEATCIGFLDGTSLCLDGCESQTDCRVGYRCRPVDATGTRVCYRNDEDGPPAGHVGADCGSDADCAETLTCDIDLPGGYCVQADCGAACPDGAACVEGDGASRCMDRCEQTRDCRIGYVCDAVAGSSICQPAESAPPAISFVSSADALGIACGATMLSQDDGRIQWRLDFEIPDGATSYIVTPFVKTGSILPLTLTHPAGTLDLVEDYRHLNLRVTEFQFYDQEGSGTYGVVAFDWPILVPYAPQYQELVAPGPHSLQVVTSVDEPCLYVTTSDGGGTRLDLNVYFVGVEGYGAQTAPTNPDLTAVFGRVDEILGAAGITLGEVAFFDAPREIAERYGVVRSLAEVKRATAFGVPRDETLGGHLNVDVFLVQDIAVDGATVLGLSAGLPGPPGLHGNSGNGLLFTTADLGIDNDFVAHVMAHELGHYLGLRHTTEVVRGTGTDQEAQIEALLGTADPIEDTPVCSRLVFNPGGCPDLDNLMFPSAPLEPIDPVVTPGQAAVLRGNPLLH